MLEKIRTIPRPGSVSADVVTLQKALIANNFNPGSTDGVFGPKTKAAVSKFQRASGLPGSGTPGPQTIKFLGLAVEAVSPVTGEKTITQDLEGKLDRHLHPSVRIMIESIVFPGGVIPEIFTKADLTKVAKEVDRAIASLGIHEKGGNNRGQEVGWIQGTTGPAAPGGNGDSWCLDYGQVRIAFMEDFFKIESPVPATAHCVTCWNGAKKIPGLTTQIPTEGTLALGQYKPSSSGHAMNVVEVYKDGTMLTNQGNTSIKNLADGDGSGLKKVNTMKNGGLTTLGFVFVYPNNKLPAVV